MEPTIIRFIRIGLVILAIILFIWFIIWLFSPKSSDTTEDEAQTTQSAQVEQYANVRFVQDGAITAPETHYSISITISGASRRIDVYQGYDKGPIKSESYPNDSASYEAFYSALKQVGFFNEKENAQNYDRTSFCPLGIRYSYVAGNDIADPSINAWSASCNKRAGTFNGNKSNVSTLFKEQIPEYSDFIEGVSLY